MLPMIEVLVIDHASHALRVVFKGGKGDDIAITIQNRDRKIRRFYQFQNPRIRVHPIVGIVLAYLLQIDNLIRIVRISSPQNDSLVIEISLVNVSCVHGMSNCLLKLTNCNLNLN